MHWNATRNQAARAAGRGSRFAGCDGRPVEDPHDNPETAFRNRDPRVREGEMTFVVREIGPLHEMR